MDDINSTEWWRWKLYRLISDFLYNPTEVNEASLQSVIKDYRRLQQRRGGCFGDEHERLMDYF